MPQKMKLKLLILFCLQIVVFQACLAQGEKCENVAPTSGNITFSSFRRSESVRKCWYINTPEENYVRLTLIDIDMRDPYCQAAYIEVTDDNSEEKSKICQEYSSDTRNWTKTFLGGGVTVTLNIRNNYYRSVASFNFEYHIENFACARKDSFRCSENHCIYSNQVCDGEEDCENGADEEECGIPTITGVRGIRAQYINWLKTRQTDFGWGRNTHRAITALYLTGAAKFRGTKIEEEVMVKQLELKTAISLFRNSTSPMSVNELSMYVNALSLTCHNNRNFYGTDLLKILASRVLSSSSRSPGAYLTLCNANWPFHSSNVVDQLLDHLDMSKETEYPFVLEIQAMTVMALSCIRQKTDLFNPTNNGTYEETLRNFMQNQNPDGSFGNVHTTAMVTQALISSGEKENNQWSLDNAIKFLTQNINSSNSVDFLSVYLSLPLFKGKTLVDLGSVDCSKYQRKNGEDDDITEVMDRLGGKAQVQFSLYIGNNKDVVHVLHLKVRENITVFDVMKVAAVADHKYKFTYHNVRDHVYVYEMAGITNDMEAGKYWFLYAAPSNKKEALRQYTASPDEIVIENKEHLVMWYKSADM